MSELTNMQVLIIAGAFVTMCLIVAAGEFVTTKRKYRELVKEQQPDTSHIEKQRAAELSSEVESKDEDPLWVCIECGNTSKKKGMRTQRYYAGDADVVCNTCGSTQVAAGYEAAFTRLRYEIDVRAAKEEQRRELNEVAVAIAQRLCNDGSLRNMIELENRYRELRKKINGGK